MYKSCRQSDISLNKEAWRSGQDYAASCPDAFDIFLSGQIQPCYLNLYDRQSGAEPQKTSSSNCLQGENFETERQVVKTPLYACLDMSEYYCGSQAWMQ